MFLSMSSGDSILRSDNSSLIQASIVTIADHSLPLLISSPQRPTAWWCRFTCILFRVWLLHLRSMCGTLSDPPYKGQVAGSVIWLHLLVCLSVCIVSVPYLRVCMITMADQNGFNLRRRAIAAVMMMIPKNRMSPPRYIMKNVEVPDSISMQSGNL